MSRQQMTIDRVEAVQKPSEMARKVGFWSLDWIRGSKIRRHYKDICHHFGAGESRTGKEAELSDILTHAARTTGHYGRLGVGKMLHDFPIVNKSIIRETFGNFMSKAFPEKECFSIVTSGSTGTPFRVLQNADKRFRNYADSAYFAKRAGFEIGHELIYLKIWAKEKMEAPWVYKMRNIMPVDVLNLREQEIETLLSYLETKSSTFGILGYSSALEAICKHIEKVGGKTVRAKIRSVVAMSEALEDLTRQGIRRYFGVEAVSRYSNLENGILAQEEEGVATRSGFLVNTASYVVEILDLERDEPVHPGDVGRIVVTDLYNYAMPMIRYDTGDVGVLSRDSTAGGLVWLSSIEGRQLDMLFDTKGRIVSSFIVYKNMWKYTEIDQYQLIQEGEKKYRIRISIRQCFERERELVSEFREYLGADAEFQVDYVNEIPVLKSGKRKKVVNLLRQGG